ncbi:hypothetical protein HOY82DRAFT_595166 [Tuber indicum]|nr:hypothetical protein HOY82DRAFT_595166 [Tuber indicum]
MTLFLIKQDRVGATDPRPCINTLHGNGTQVFGNFIVKHYVGSIALSRLLDKDSKGEYIFTTQLGLVAETYGLDGWPMNIEASFPGEGFRPGGLQPFLKTSEALRWN